MKEIDESQDSIIIDEPKPKVDNNANLTYRLDLEEKLRDISGELLTGRGPLTHDSKKYKNLNNAINDVLNILEQHNGEEWLNAEDKRDLEEKITIMKNHARVYRNDKIDKGATALNAPKSLKKRFEGANKILSIESEIPDNPGPEYGIVPPDQLEPGDIRETKWELKWKQNVRYLAKKQIYTYTKNLRKLEANDDLTQNEFDALMDFMEPDKILSYKNDADLCQKYPNMRLKMEQAIRANEKLQDMSQNEINAYMNAWKISALEKSMEAAKKSAERKGRTFTAKDRKNVEEKLNLLISDKVKKFSTKEVLTEKADVLEQVARFVDLKMAVISDKRYVNLDHTNKFGRRCSVKEYDKILRKTRNDNEWNFYNNLRDLRELENAGIWHKKGQTEKTYYSDINETLHTTVKKEMFGFRIGKVGYKGVSTINDAYGANENSTYNTTRYGKDIKCRVGKIGLKLHSKHKSVQLSGGVVFGQLKQGTSIGANIGYPGADAMMTGEFSAVKARVKLTAGKGPISGSIGGNANAGYAFGILKGGLGHIAVKDENGKEYDAYGIAGNAGFVLSAFKGGGSASISILGIRISASLSTYLAGIGGNVGGQLTVGEAKFSLGGVLGIGAGLSFSINWTEAYSKAKALWRKSRLKKLISNYKERKRLRQNNRNNLLEIREEKDLIDREIANPEKGKGSADKKLEDDDDNIIRLKSEKNIDNKEIKENKVKIEKIEKPENDNTINRSNSNKNINKNKNKEKDETNIKRSKTNEKNKLPHI